MSNVLIIGGSRGIGRAAVRAFRDSGHNVVFTYHKSELEADALRQECGAVPVRCDVKHSDSVRIAVNRAIETMGQIDVLICNAAVADYNLITDINETRWEEIINTNLNGVFYAVHHVLPSMISRKNGCIITVSSMWGEVGASCEVAYSASKAGVIGLTKALAKEVGPSGIRVNCVSPGLIDTDMNKTVDESAIEEIAYETPLGRVGNPDEVAKVMEFLASDDASFITGQIIPVNGGLI
ncbi:MAG: 3-oxoacyl-ACP reductase FabG [Mogibacterium sp.]|nr:3-oxoacyl-ACP reductase FabG [Mogibacterium sp.]